MCVNQEGNYTCACNPGYTLHGDGRCVGEYDMCYSHIPTESFEMHLSTHELGRIFFFFCTEAFTIRLPT